MTLESITNGPVMGEHQKGHDLFLFEWMVKYKGLVRDVLRLVLARMLLSVLNLGSVKFVRKSYVTKTKKELRPDGVISVWLKESEGSDPPVILVVEFMSHPNNQLKRRLVTYMNQIASENQDSVVMGVVLYHNENTWNFDTVYPTMLSKFSKKLHKQVLRPLHTRLHFLSLCNAKELKRALKLKFAPFFYILANYWKMSGKVIARMYELAWDNFYTDFELHRSVVIDLRDYIQWRYPEIGDQEFLDIERKYIPKEKRIMEQALTYDDLINEKHVQKGVKKGRQEGRQEGRHERNQEIAENMIRDNLNDSSIAKYSGLSLEEVSEIRHKLNGDGS